MYSSPVLGFLPNLLGQVLFLKTPNLGIFTSLFLELEDIIDIKESNRLIEFFFESDVFKAILLAISLFVIDICYL
tara:strand:+ start:114 stop:338 length:225 start_codon:yes stop_codon:yes gene_type:complete